MTCGSRPRYLAAPSRGGEGWVVEDQATEDVVARFPFGGDVREAARLASLLADELNKREEGR